MTRKIFIKEVFRYLYLSVIICISVLPIVWIVMSSFKTNGEILNNALSIPKSLSIKNYITAFGMSPIGKFYINSIIIAFVTTTVVLVIYSMSAYVFARFEFKLKAPIFMLFSMTILIPTTALLFPVYVIMSKLGIYDSKLALIIVYTALSMPITLFILRSYLLTIPKEIEEAATIDGAGFIKTFALIVLPMIKPGMASAGILSFLVSWNDFLYALILTSGNENRTLPVAIQYFTGMFSSDYGALFASAVLIVMPSVIVYLLLQKQIVGGLVAGAVKG